MARIRQVNGTLWRWVLLVCLLGGPGLKADICIAGSDMLGDGFARTMAAYARRNDLVVHLELQGTRPGLADLEAARADLALLLLPADELPPRGAMVSRIIGYQVAVIVVSPASPLRQLTHAQLRAIFARSAGDAFTRWGELDLTGPWTARPIILQALAPAAGLAYPLFERIFLREEPARAGVEFAPNQAAFIGKMRASTNSIGITGAGAAGRTGLNVLALAKSPTDPAYGPTAENVHTGDYPLRLPLYVSFPRQAATRMQGILKFLLSAEMQAALAPAHFVALPPVARNQLVLELEDLR